MMRISIVIDNYNYARYLPAAIDCALAQTWADTEVIVIDDGSTDDSSDVLDRYSDAVITMRQVNQGQGVALANGFARSTGDAVIFLDADDTLDPNACEVVAGEFARQANAARVQWPQRVIDANGTDSGAVTPDPKAMASGDLREHIVSFRTHVWPATSGNAFSRRALHKLMPIPADFVLGGDLYLAETSALLGPVVSIPEPIGSYRKHGNNNWLGRDVHAEFLHQKMAWTTANHEHVKQVGEAQNLYIPDSVTEALDVAFICQRLASLRLDPAQHPFPGDSRLGLTVRGIHAAIVHPHHRPLHKVKRVAWLLGTGAAPLPVARQLIQRFYR